MTRAEAIKLGASLAMAVQALDDMVCEPVIGTRSHARWISIDRHAALRAKVAAASTALLALAPDDVIFEKAAS